MSANNDRASVSRGYTWEVDAHLHLKRSWVLGHATALLMSKRSPASRLLHERRFPWSLAPLRPLRL